MENDRPGQPDAELVSATLAGDDQAFRAIVARYQGAVFAVVLSRVRNFHDAEDVAQGVFLEAYRRLGNLAEAARLGAWLRSIAIHRSIDHLRRPRVMTTDRAGELADRPGEDPARADLRERVLAAVARLSKTQRETTTLFYIDGYSVARVAGIQEVPVGTVKRRLHDARERLKEEMIHMVEDVLKDEAPSEDFAERVFEVLDQRGGRRGWRESARLLREIGEQGIEGFVRALRQPHWQTRRFAAQMANHSLPVGEPLVELFKAMRDDSSRKVRKHAAPGLLNLDVPRERKIGEFIPLLIPLLTDRSAKVRWRTAYELTFWAEHVPLAASARALADERHPRARGMQARLVRRIAEVEQKAQN